ncbi:MAG: SUMF1/EgtB/PvdO family nonheme iron enzyme [Desmonostoc vinosum HA7617-LM4]|jgi:formylglycine-generating enzyme required for sulfatase activity/energy-coupling factor transporter ATP-binding protein EcfA2|nr:SUMF1/EgtB/PvdO family nonheme iron enzyme [Desmonostoc vinosum HA7617-LM4]
MHRFVKALLLPLLLISSNGVLGWLINQLPSKQDLHIPDSTIFWLTGGCIVALLIVTLLSSDPQQNSATTNQNWIGGFLPLVGGMILVIALYLKLVPTEFSTVFSYASIGMFGLGVILPPVLILPKSWRKFLLWLIPSATLFLTVHFIRKQQSTAAILSLIFTVIITVILASQDFWKKLIAELSVIWQEWQRQGAASVAAWIKSKLEDWWIELTSPFQKDYYETLIYKCRRLETQGLDGDGKLDLEKVFVQLKISVQDVDNISQRMIDQHPNQVNNQKEFPIWKFLAPKHVAGNISFPHMVILGAPGSGKTTLLRHITLIYATKQESKINPPAPKLIPVLLYLREVRQEIVSNNPSLANLITQQVAQQRLKDKPPNPPPGWFADKLYKKKCLVMLDGLDEVADQSQRQYISRWVSEQMQNYPDTAFILTSRPNGYKTARLQGVEELEVQPFNEKQREDFLHHWYLQKTANDNHWVIDEGVKQDAQTEANDLIKRIQKNRPLRAMGINPLLLTMIATVHRRRNVLPGKRVKLYKEICEILLEKRQTAKKISDVTTNPEAKQSVLQVLALQLMQKKTREFIISEVTSLIPVDMLQTFPQNLANPEDFIKHIRDDCGLLVEKELGIYEFAHLSFQEYLAAVQIEKSHQESLLIANINDTWWAETIRLYAAQITNARNVVRAVIDMPTPSVNAFLLVSDYEEEGWSIDAQLKQQLIDKLDAGLESSDPEIFKLAAQVKLARRLNNLQPIDENLEIDTGYITCAEYQLFLDSSQLSQPRFTPGNAKKSITGISWENALGFCNWLNLYTLSQSGNSNENNPVYYYRLPTLAEAQNYLAQAKCWTINGSNTGEKRIYFVKNRVSQEYIKLANYLAARDWEKAAQSTVKVMLKVANFQSEGEFDVASIKKLPYSFFSTIDLLWMQYSIGRFGWGVRESTLISPAPSNPSCGWWLNADRNIKEIFEALVQKHIACGIDRLPPVFAFDVVTVNVQGQEIQWECQQSQYFTENLGNGVTLDMVAIRDGTFTMGSPSTEQGHHETEEPQHEVTVPRFFMSKYPVTQAQWRVVATLPQINRQLNSSPSHFKGDDLPVESISWYDAVEFCDRLSKHARNHYRLPSEAEWEYACRGGTTTEFYFGKTITPKLANYSNQKTTPVGSFKVANAFGLYDMHGNVWEWCADKWHENYKGAPKDGSAWGDRSENDNQRRLLRGGSWDYNLRYCRCAVRYYYGPGNRYSYIGFRVVVSAART